MRVEIASMIWYNVGDLIRHYPQLREFGLEVTKFEQPDRVTIEDTTYECGCAIAYTPYIHLNTVEDIFKLGNAVKHNIIFHDDQNLVVIADE